MTIQITFHHATHGFLVTIHCCCLTCLASLEKTFAVIAELLAKYIFCLTYIFKDKNSEHPVEGHTQNHMTFVLNNAQIDAQFGLEFHWFFNPLLPWFSLFWSQFSGVLRSKPFGWKCADLGFLTWQIHHDWKEGHTLDPNILLSAAVSECESILLGRAHQATKLAEGVEQLSWTVKEHRLSAVLLRSFVSKKRKPPPDVTAFFNKLVPLYKQHSKDYFYGFCKWYLKGFKILLSIRQVWNKPELYFAQWGIFNF